MEISIKWNICRVCLREGRNSSIEDASSSSQQMKNLFGEDDKLVHNIYELSGVSMKPGDFLPDKICHKCVSVINNAVQLRKTCRSSNTYLKSILERTKSASTFFKPRKHKNPVCDDAVKDDNTETKPSTGLDNDVEGANSENQKKFAEISEYKKDPSNAADIESLEQQESESQQEHIDNLSDYIVEMEEVVEVSDEMEDQIFFQLTEDDDTEVNMQNESNKCNNHDPLQNSKIDKDIENENLASNDNEGFENAEGGGSDQDMEYDIIDGDVKLETDDMDEALIIHYEEKINDDENQAQVSSTVDTNEEIKHYEHSSNISNATSDIEEDCLEGINLNKIPSGDSSETSFHTNETVVKLEYTPSGNRKSPIFSRRKIKGNSLDNAASQICVCDICGNQYTNRNLMNIHMKVHYQSKNHQCELCLKSFITACNLQAHMRIHTGERPFECRYCHRRFNDRSSNIRHERTHTNEKPFECANCGKTFTLATTLQNHMKVHTNERSYRCEPCGKSFKLPHHLKTHQNTSLHKYVLGI